MAPDPNLSFVILVRLPYVSMASRLQTIKNFTVVTDQMSVRFGEMTNLAIFKNITATLGRGLISANYLAAEDISLKSRTSSIMGTFNVSRSLNVNTTNGGLSSRVILHNPALIYDPYVNDTATYLSPMSEQSYLDIFRRNTPVPRYDHSYQSKEEDWQEDVSSSVTSVWTGTTSSVFSSENVSRYMDPNTAPVNPIKIRAATTNGPLSIQYIYQAPGVVLDSSVQTRNGEARTEMHPAFQGSFLVRSVNGDMRMDRDYNGTVETDDPWYISRTKLVLFNQGGNLELGGWNETSMEFDEDIKPQYGNLRGGMAYNYAEGSWVSTLAVCIPVYLCLTFARPVCQDVSGTTLWLTNQELSSNDNITETILGLASACPYNNATLVDPSCTGASAMRRSRSVTQTSWGGAELSFST